MDGSEGMKKIDVVSISGGKDSTALWLLAIEMGIKVHPVFADTGNEHPMTYEYIEYLESKLGSVKRVMADFSKQIAKKREYVNTVWREEGVDVFIIMSALAMLHPTGNPFLDLCIWKGRFPSRKAQFCTQFLKREPIFNDIVTPALEAGDNLVMWQGIRADESPLRAGYPEREETPEGYEIYRPILNWNVEQVFEMHDKYGIEPNPLYKLGMSRVGCMPCINCKKSELFEIQRRFPEQVERIAEWERIVGKAAKRGESSFFKHDNVAGKGILEWVEWSKTVRGGAAI